MVASAEPSERLKAFPAEIDESPAGLEGARIGIDGTPLVEDPRLQSMSLMRKHDLQDPSHIDFLTAGLREISHTVSHAWPSESSYRPDDTRVRTQMVESAVPFPVVLLDCH